LYGIIFSLYTQNNFTYHMKFNNLTNALKSAVQDEQKGVIFVYGGSEEVFLSYRNILDKALCALTNLRARGITQGDTLIFQVYRQDEFIVAYWACLLGGIVPVPVAVGNNDEHRLKLFNVWGILDRPKLLADEKVIGWLQKFAQKNNLEQTYQNIEANLIRLEELFAAATPAEPIEPSGEDLAFIQFSSGSTGTPKGVMLTHNNLLINTNSLATSFESPTGEERLLSWMPLTHDMGLIGYHLTPLTRGWTHCIMDTNLFIRRPGIWLNKVAEHSITVTASPNFGFEYVLKFLSKPDYSSLDLSKLRFILNGAEPISYDLCVALEEAFKPYGIHHNITFPGYGLAEGSLAITTCRPNEDLVVAYLDRLHLKEGDIVEYTDKDSGAGFVCVGRPLVDVEVQIGNENGKPYGENTIGEIQIRGGNVTQGYFNNPEATAKIKHEGGWTSTGDLGFMKDGRLYITGRKKDIIFVNGGNLYPHDMERIAETVEGVELGKVAVVGVDTQAGKGEIVAFLYTKESDPNTIAPIALEIRRKINAAFNVELDHILPTKVMPRTTSGKLQRYKLIEYYLEGQYNQHKVSMAEAMHKAMYAENVVMPTSLTEQKLLQLWESVLGKQHLNLTDKFFEVGGTSLKAAELATLIIAEYDLDDDFTTNTIIEHPTVEKLAAYLDTLLPATATGAAEVPTNEESKAKATEEAEEAPDYKIEDNDIAVVGMYARFPGSETLEEFWNNLSNGKETLRSFTEEELLESGLTEEEIHSEAFVNIGGSMKDAEYFDYKLFGYTPQEAARMSPQMRVFHQAVYASLEDANVNPDTYRGKIGLFTGATSDLLWDAGHIVKARNDAEEFQSFIFNSDYISTRVSYKLNLRGPSYTFNTACSSSLVAIQLAYRSILSGDSDMAVAGGVSLFGKKGHMYEEGMIMSHNGQCRAFDKDSNGTVRGSGVGIVVLKRLKNAIEDKDQVYAVIKGACINNDGNAKMDYTAPSVEGQQDAIRCALEMAGVQPEQIGYVEAHGTGTKLGDPIEIQALTRAYATEKRNYCAIGSVKTNFGHLEIAAGVAGFIKAALMLKHKTMVPSLHFHEPNPAINFQASPFYVVTERKLWEKTDGLRYAGVSSFGIGGTNAHVILQEPPVVAASPKKEKAHDKKHQLVMLSANSKAALQSNEANLLAYLEKNPETCLQALAYTLQTGRKLLPFKKAYISDSIAELKKQLTAGADNKEFVVSHSGKPQKHKIVFLFPGGGSQYINMGRELYEQEPVFRQHLDECLGYLRPSLREELMVLLYPAAGVDHEAQTAKLRQIRYFHPVIFIFEYALARLLMHWGIQPDALIGHSLGEFVAATLAGVFHLEEALEIVTERGRLMQSVEEGHMMSVNLSEEALRPLLTEGIDLGAVNAPELCVISGKKKAVEALAGVLEARDIKHNILHISHASHSHMMEPILDQFEDVLHQSNPGKPLLPVVSSLTGKWLTAREAMSPTYWSSQMRGTVRFADGLKTIFDQPDQLIFLEVGAGKTLSTFARQHNSRRDSDKMIELVRHPKEEVSDCRFLLDKIARLIFLGVEVDMDVLRGHLAASRLHLPTYAFDKVPFELGKGWRNNSLLNPGATDEQLKKNKNNKEWFYSPGWKTIDLIGSQQLPYEQALLLVREALQGEQLKNLFATQNIHLHIAVVGPGSGKATYQEAVAALSAEKQTLVLHALTLGYDAATLEEQAAQGFFSLMHLTNELAALKAENIELVVLTNDCTGAFSDDFISEKGSILGAVRVIPQEYPSIHTRLVELPSGDALQQATGRLLLRELAETQSVHTVITYYRNRRWVESFEAISISDNENNNLRKWGTYLITGAMGDVGMILANHLASVYKANLVLTGRTSLTNGPAEKVKLLKEKIASLEAKGARVLYFAADTADTESMRNVLNETKETFGKLNGVIHAVGVLSEDTFVPMAMMADKLSNLQAQAHAKVAGARVLADLLAAESLDFCLLTSSISAVLGGHAFGGYAAVNIYTDLAVRSLNKSSTFPWITVDLDVWQVSAEGAEFSIESAEGGALLENVLKLLPAEHVIVSVADLNRRIAHNRRKFQAQNALPEEGAAIASVDRPDIMAEYVAPETPTQHKLVAIWQEVLGYKQLGILDDFFELGADSLRVVAVNGRIGKAFGINIPLKVFFSNRNIAKLADYIDRADVQKAAEQIVPAPEMEYYPMTASQKRFYLLNQIDEGGLSYNMPQLISLKAAIGTAELNTIFQAICQHHETFRTSFHVMDGQPVQRIHPSHKVVVNELRIQKKELEATRKALIQPFDLSQKSALRLTHIIIEDNPGEHYLFLDAHHIIFDGVSLINLVRDIYDLYEGKALQPRPLSLKDFAVWEKKPEQLKSRELKKSYRLNQFSDHVPVLDLPLDHERPKKNTYRGSYLKFILNETETAALQKFTKENDATLFMVLLSVYYVFLHRVTGQEDIVVGTPVAGRQAQEELNQIIGVFLNTLALRNQVNGEATFAEVFTGIKNNTLEAFENQDYPFDELLEALRIKRDPARHPLFDVYFALQNHAVEVGNQSLFDESELYVEANEVAKFDLNLTSMVKDGMLQATLSYNVDLFEGSTAAAFLQVFRNILREIIANPQVVVNQLNVLDAKEQRDLIAFSTIPGLPLPEGKTVLHLIAEQVAATPDAVALVHEKNSLSYGAFYERSCQLAATLQENNIRPGDVVAVRTAPCMDWITAIIATNMAGATFLPIDPKVPLERVNYMLQDAAVRCLLTDTPDFTDTVPVLDIREEKYFTGRDYQYVESSTAQIAYLIYTSGSTGAPKGVKVSHLNLLNFVIFNNNYFQLTPEDKTVRWAGPAFDASIWEVLPTLVAGASIHVLNEEQRLDLVELNNYFNANGITFVFLSSQLAEQFMELDNHSLRFLNTGGDKLRRWKRNAYRLYNNYGPTETTVIATAWEVTEDRHNLPIGKPFANVEIYILKEGSTSMQPAGIPGEIVIGGAGVSQGYLNNPELTQIKFIDNPWRKGEKMYRTGDRGRLLPDGNIEFLGRIDNQVQIRGYRVELGEIEKAMMKVAGVQEAAVLYWNRQEGESLLCGYAVAPGLEEKEIIAQLKNWLPYYMVPSQIMMLAAMPLSNSNKLDRKALPVPVVAVSEYTAPSTPLEVQLAEAFADVLQVPKEQISVDGNFFELGGHSLKMTILVDYIRKKLGYNITMPEAFARPTVAELTSLLQGQLTAESSDEIVSAPEQEAYPLTPAQRRMYILQQLTRNSTAYNMAQAFEIPSEVTVEQVTDILQQLVSRHQALRTSFHQEGEALVQRIARNITIDISLVEDYSLTADSYLTTFVQPFDLAKAPLIRAALLKQEDKQYLLLDLHHIIADGVSVDVFIDEFNMLYRGESLPALEVNYCDYVLWREKREQTEGYQQQRNYWLNRIDTGIPKLTLPYDFPVPSVRRYEGDFYALSIDESLLNQLEEMARKEGATLSMAFLAAYFLFLQKLTGSEAASVGMPVAGRPLGSLARTVGVFINTLPIQHRFEKEGSYTNLLRNIRATVLEVLDHQEYPFEEMVDALRLPKDTASNPVFDLLFNYFGDNTSQKDDNVLLSKGNLYGNAQKVSKFDLSLMVFVHSKKAEVIFEYATSLFRPATVNNFGRQFLHLLQEIVRRPEAKLHELSLISDEEKQRQINEWVQGPVSTVPAISLNGFLDQVTQADPDAIALRFGHELISRDELRKKSNQVAHWLQSVGVQPGDVVALCMKRSPALVASIFGILKAGAAYLPVDPELPLVRKDYLIKDSCTKLLIADTGLAAELDTVAVYEYQAVDFAGYSDENPPVEVHPDDRAYVIYTSGSTGEPKGVQITHKSAVNQVTVLAEYLGITKGDTLLFKTPYMFDVSVTELFGWMPVGASLAILPAEGTSDLSLLHRTLTEQKVSILNFVPSVFYAYLNYLEINAIQELPYLRIVVFAGEALPADLVSRLWKVAPDLVIENIYGPTEITVYATAWRIPQAHNDKILIGKPLPNYQAYVLDEALQVVPAGYPGELYVGGAGVAIGYLNKPALTAERFIPNPFGTDRLYKTGDMVRWNSKGEIEYLGRTDFQVKINGLRIETGDIEFQLRKAEGIRECLVVAREVQGSRCLVAYYTSEQPAKDLQKHLMALLPAYMVPTYFVWLPAMPLNNNGKVDRAQLPAPQLEVSQSTEVVNNARQQEIQACFAELLSIPAEQVGLTRSFFELGGNSLKATFLLTRLQRTYGLELSLTDIFKHPSVEALAQLLDSRKLSGLQIQVKDSDGTHLPLSRAQKRLYYLYKVDPKRLDYNLPHVFTVDQLDEARLSDAINTLISKHDALRIVISEENGEVSQSVRNDVTLQLEVVDQREKDVVACIKSMIRPFDLTKELPVRMGVIRLNDGRYTVVMDMHHIVSDGVTLRILLKELEAAYQGKTIGAPAVRFRDFVLWEQETLITSEQYAYQKSWWLSQLQEAYPKLNLPVDFEQASRNSASGGLYRIRLEGETAEAVRKAAQQVGLTPYMFLLSGFVIVLHKLCSQHRFAIGTPLLGRNYPHMDEIAGMFVNTLPLRFRLEEDQQLSELFEQVKTRVFEVFDYQDVHLDELVQALTKEQKQLFDVVFTYENIAEMAYDASNQRFGIKEEPYTYDERQAKFHLTLTCVEDAAGLLLNFEYRSDLFREETIAGISELYCKALTTLADNLGGTLASITLADSVLEEVVDIEAAFGDEFLF
jgi:amino acid adenylation domain-containing protein